MSHSFNIHSLKLSMRRMYDTNPEENLHKIFRRSEPREIQLSPQSKSHRRKSADSKASRKRSACDSSFRKEEADLIMDELKQIRSPKVWGQVMNSFRTKPALLFDLIPLKVPFRRKLRGKHSKVSVVPENDFESCTPEVVETMYEENECKYLTDDWAKSKLNLNVKNGIGFACEKGFTEDQLKTVQKRIPRNGEELKNLHVKGMNTLEELLVELLGTKEDASQFGSRFRDFTPSVVKALLSKCMELMSVRKTTADILALIQHRERLLRRVRGGFGDAKGLVLQIYKLNTRIRVKVNEWAQNSEVPFDEFVFKGKNYLVKISEDNIELQKLLLKAYKKC